MAEFIFFGMLFVVLTCVVINQMREETANESLKNDWGRAKADLEKEREDDE
jgi:hypothetical protein